VPIYDNRNNVSYPCKRLNSFSKALLGFASLRGIVDGKTGDYLSPGQGSPAFPFMDRDPIIGIS
jgi:hypothetical protein